MGYKTCGKTCDEHVSTPCEFVFALDLSFQPLTVGFAISCAQRCILVNLNTSTVAFIEI